MDSPRKHNNYITRGQQSAPQKTSQYVGTPQYIIPHEFQSRPCRKYWVRSQYLTAARNARGTLLEPLHCWTTAVATSDSEARTPPYRSTKVTPGITTHHRPCCRCRAARSYTGTPPWELLICTYVYFACHGPAQWLGIVLLLSTRYNVAACVVVL